MTEPVSVPARQRAPLATPSAWTQPPPLPSPYEAAGSGPPGADMSPSGRLCLFITVGLILPTRGQIIKEVITPTDPATEIIHVPTSAPDDEQGMEATPNQMTMEAEVLLTTGQGTDKSTTQGSKEDDPFFYDEDTLRKRGLMVAAVLFITGIVILTSGKCRQLPRLCWNRDR
ncbi:FXYD domain-containing ion transport regulator 5 isoform X3 [Bubalus bubalis]|uniref:FXYD domain-containing ion transport regulator 5 isoform X3 n=1 Tax=Bubalus bubalis TaxID=89462 RepID=UPI001E1B95EE|nr:FXYD domain-containing ion transport regulator 5 isoform X3 [Bubalus bubalis]